MKNRVLEVEIKKTIECSLDVAFWNYWDHEHLDVIHDSYKKSDILYDKNNFMFRVDSIKVPGVPFFKFMTPIFMVQHNRNTLITYAMQLGILSKTTITIKEIGQKKSQISMNYKFYLNGWRVFLRPILKKLIPRWNERVWNEDLPVKLRRQMVTDMNFKDFYGMPANLIDRKKFETKKDLKLPIPRPKNSSRDRHPLKHK